MKKLLLTIALSLGLTAQAAQQGIIDVVKDAAHDVVNHELAKPVTTIAGCTATVMGGKWLYDNDYFNWVRPTAAALGNGIAVGTRTVGNGVINAVTSIKAGDVALTAVVAGTGAVSYGLYKAVDTAAQTDLLAAVPSGLLDSCKIGLAALPAAYVAYKCSKSAFKNSVLHEDADKQAQNNRMSSTSLYPLAYINKLTSCRSTASYLIIEDFATDVFVPGADLEVVPNPNNIFALKTNKLRGELAKILQCGNDSDVVTEGVFATIQFIHAELDHFKKYTDIESALVSQAQRALGQVGAPLDARYFRDTDALLRQEVFDQLENWCNALQATHWADKFFKVRYHLTKVFNKTTYYPYYSSITYNGASRYVVQLLKQLGRLQALEKVLSISSRNRSTHYSVVERI